jgi:formylglycine-generating enzyme required for sulfatase activity
MRRIERISTRAAGCAAAVCCSVLATGAAAQSCSGDLNRDGTVSGADLGLLLGQWGGGGGAVLVPRWAELVEALPDPAVVTDSALRQAIHGTGLAWRVRDRVTHVEMLLVPPGQFRMGCSQQVIQGNGGDTSCDQFVGEEADRGIPRHDVNITKPFYLARFELTQAQWQAQMGNNGSNHQSFPQVDLSTFSLPADGLLWRDVQRYLASSRMRLPTEAEWESACRAGVDAPFYDGSSSEGSGNGPGLDSLAWFANSPGQPADDTHAVGTKKANRLGFHDMLGNVDEPVSDWYAAYSYELQTDPIGPASGSHHVWRGGAWDRYSDSVTTAFRQFHPWADDSDSLEGAGHITGLRVARSPGSAFPSGDLNADGQVNGADLGIVLGAWGACSMVVVPAWAELVYAQPDPAVVTDPALRAAIAATGLAWHVRDAETHIEMMLIPPGTFQMGCSIPPSDGDCKPFELPAHPVKLTAAVYIGRDEVTQAQWQAQMGTNPSEFNGGADAPRRPVESVALTGPSSIEQFLISTGMRLPTEAEWEYACRAGTLTPIYNGSADLGSLGGLAWFDGNSGGTTHPAGQLLANGFGLRDMLGNVAEWVVDIAQTYEFADPGDPTKPQFNPTGPQSNGPARNSGRRGGSWNEDRSRSTAAARSLLNGGSSTADHGVGFRVARNP